LFGSQQNIINISFYAILPAAIILYYVYKRDKFPEPPRVVLVTLFLGFGITFPLMLLIPFAEGILENLDWDIESNNFYMSFIRASFLEETMKFLILVYYCLHLDEFDEPMDALVYGVAASLGFAVFENWEYVMGAAGESIGYAKDVAFARAFSAVPMHALAGVFMGFFLMDAVFEKANRKLNLFLALFFPVCLHGLYDLILFSNNISNWWIYILVGVFLVRAFFIFRKQRNLQSQKIRKKTKNIPINSEIFFVVIVSLFILITVNYMLNIYNIYVH
jgi:RsiW-degrading membrane proteinase PrsW (M82 family)